MGKGKGRLPEEVLREWNRDTGTAGCRSLNVSFSC
jgi:hypothetical protein